MVRATLHTTLLAAALAAQPGLVSAGLADYELSGKVTGELRYFTQDAQFSDQGQTSNLSISAQPELYWEWNNGNDSLTFTPFLRLDQHDNERSHGDIRELSWLHVSDDWELRAGLRKVFWGVTEFQHLVDVINQTDGVEDIDGEDKLGQAMINLSLVKDWGIVDLYLLPGFRERTFPGADGRLRSGLVVDTDAAQYESGAKEKHLDTAIRWSHSVDVLDLGLYWFHGTNRDPILTPRLNSNGDTVLVPLYEQMDQLGVDIQATVDSWLWKFEAIHRDTARDDFLAAQSGVEYTFYGLQDSAADLGVLVEYGWDERGTRGGQNQNDLFVGGRFTLNDADSSELLAGISHDLDHDSTSVLIEASRRVGNNWKISLDGRFFQSDTPADPSYAIRQDDHLQLSVERYF